MKQLFYLDKKEITKNDQKQLIYHVPQTINQIHACHQTLHLQSITLEYQVLLCYPILKDLTLQFSVMILQSVNQFFHRNYSILHNHTFLKAKFKIFKSMILYNISNYKVLITKDGQLYNLRLMDILHGIYTQHATKLWHFIFHFHLTLNQFKEKLMIF